MDRRSILFGTPAFVFLSGCDLWRTKPDDVTKPQATTLAAETTPVTSILQRTKTYSKTILTVLEVLGSVIIAAKPEQTKNVEKVLKQVRDLDKKIQSLVTDKPEYYTQYLKLAETIIDLIALVPGAGQYIVATRLLLTVIESVRVTYGIEQPRELPPSPVSPPGTSVPSSQAQPQMSLFEYSRNEALVRLNYKPSETGDDADRELKKLISRGLKAQQ